MPRPKIDNKKSPKIRHLNEVGIRIWMVPQDRVQGHDDPGRAKPTLRPVQVRDALLHRVQALGLCGGKGGLWGEEIRVTQRLGS